MLKRCYKCKHAANDICLELTRKKARYNKIIVPMQAEQCPDYVEAKK